MLTKGYLHKKSDTLLILFLYIIVALTTFIPFTNQNAIIIHKFIFSYIFILMICIVFYFQALYGITLPWHSIITISLIAMTALLHNFIVIDFVHSYIYEAALSSLIALYSLCIIYMLYTLNKTKSGLIRFFSLAAITLAHNIYYIIIIHLNKVFYFPVYIGPHVLPFFVIIFFIFGAVEVKTQRNRSEALYQNFIEQLEKKSAGPTITASSEEKLSQIIEFIKGNYTEELSREGLAAAVNINPNYFSSLFNAYTGKKFQEYINSLRIKKAAELIKDTDEKLSDIASSVGFINLSTFIRAFKKEMGKTPKEYREYYSMQNG